MDLRESINKFSEYMVMFRNRYNYIPVVIQQQNTETMGLDAFKAGKVRPTITGLGDSKYTGRDCSIMLGITNPYSHEINNYLGYDISKFKGNILFTSHDHQLTQTVANRIIDIKSDKVIDREVTYNEYLGIE